MTGSEADLLALLRGLDDPGWLEWPQHYNRDEAAALFGGLVTRLEGDFGARCTAEQDTQDSSEYGRVVVPGEAAVCGTRIVVCVSKFGSPALVCAEPDPRMYHHASTALNLAPSQCLFVDDDPSLVAAAIALGYEGRAVCRDSAPSEMPSIAALAELLDLF